MWIIFLLLFYLLLTALLLLIGGVFGYLLHWLLPKLDASISLLTGVVASGLSLHLLIKILSAVPDVEDQDIEELGESELNRLMRGRLTLVPLPRKRRRRTRNQ